jgi:bifunctional non-homologous end joining protein LigD
MMSSSAVAPYSVRARPGAPVSLPIDWTALTRLKGGDAFHIKDALKQRKDPWAGMAKAGRQKLPIGEME